MAVDGTVPGLPPATENELVAEFAQLVLAEAAPEELVLFPDTAAEYFQDPQGTLNPKQRDEAVGFGLDVAMMTPYVLAVGGMVVRFLASTVAETAIGESKPLVARLVRRMLRRGDPAEHAEAVPLSAEQLRRVREIAYDGARNMQLGDEQARLLANAVVGGLVG